MRSNALATRQRLFGQLLLPSPAHHSLARVVHERLVLNFKRAVLSLRRKRIKPAPRRAARARAIGCERTVVAGTEEVSIFVAPDHVAALVRARSRKHLIIFIWKDENEMLFDHVGPTGCALCCDAVHDRSRALELREWANVSPSSFSKNPCRAQVSKSCCGNCCRHAGEES